MSSLDDIKRKLNIDEMDQETRKKMFDKFVEKGGKVIKEDTSRKSMRFNRTKQAEVSQKIYEREKLLKAKYSTDKTTNADTVGQEKIRYPFSLFIKGLFNRTFTLSGYFNKKLVLSFDQDFIDVLSGLNFTTAQIINLEPEDKWKMVDFINGHFSLSYELILRVYDLYKLNSIQAIQKYMKTLPHIQCTSILRNIHLLYKDLVVLYPYWETTKEVLWRALGYYEKLTGKQYLLGRSKINRYLDRLFHHYLNHFHMILCYNLGDTIPFDHESMFDFAQIKENEVMGVYTKELEEEKKEYIEALKREKEEQLRKIQENIEKKELEKIPPFIQKGLKVIDEILGKSNIILKHDKNAQLFQEREKMFNFYVLWREFDRHYSFILTSTQLKLSIRLESGVRTDIRSELDEAFIKFTEVNNFLKEYIELLEEYHSLEVSHQDNLVQMSRMQNNVNLKKANTFNELKSRASLFLKMFANSLQKIHTDYNAEKLLLQNPEDLLSFQLSREKQRFDNVPIIKAIGAAFIFTSGLHYYITFDEFSQRSLFFEVKSPPREDFPDINTEIREN